MTRTPANKKEIRGIDLKQLAAFAVVIATGVGMYFDQRSEIRLNRQETLNNREFMQRMDQEAKDDREFRRLEMQALKMQINQLQVNMSVLETKISK